MAEGGSGDRFPPDMQFIDDADVTTLRDHAAAADPMDTTKMPNKIHHSHIWSDNHEPAEVHTATTDEVDNFLFSVDEIIQRNLRHNNKGANKRQISPERPMLPILPAEWLNRVLQQTLEFQEQIPAFQKPLFLMPAQFPFRQQVSRTIHAITSMINVFVFSWPS